MPSRQESTYCREGESIEMTQKRISREKSQDSATTTETQYTYDQKNVEEEQTADSFPQDIKSKITLCFCSTLIWNS
jgi:hypothetical protein